MSPEIRDEDEIPRQYGKNTDCWSAGCVLFEMITLEVYYYFILNNNYQHINEVIKILRVSDHYKILKILLEK